MKEPADRVKEKEEVAPGMEGFRRDRLCFSTEVVPSRRIKSPVDNKNTREKCHSYK